MGILGLRSIVVLVVFVFGLAWLIASGYVRWEHDDYKCFPGQKWYPAFDPQRFFSVGNVKLYYQPLAFGCYSDNAYDQSKYRVEYGELVPR